MERTLVLSAFAVGCLGWLFGMLGTWPGRNAAPAGSQELSRVSLAACVITPLLVFLATLPSHPPFAAGQGLGRGFVAGALGALLAGALTLRADRRFESVGESLPSAAAAAGPYFMGAAVVSAPLLWLQPVLTDALLGAAIGWFVNSFLLIVIPGTGTMERTKSTLGLALNAGFAITLAVTVALGDYRGGVRFGAALMPVSWRAITLTLGACVPLLMLVCALPAAWIVRLLTRLPLAGVLTRAGAGAIKSESARDSMARVWRVVAAAVTLLATARLFSLRIEHRPPLLQLAAIGIAICLAAWWLSHQSASRMRNEDDAAAAEAQNAALGALVVMCGVMAAYQLFSGVGIGVVLLSGWLVAGLALHGVTVAGAKAGDTGRQSVLALPALLTFGLVVELYRFISVRFGAELHGVGLTDHYALFGMVIGSMVPIMLAGYLLRRRTNLALPGGGEMIGRAIVAGALTLAAPLTLILLFGVKCELACCFGLALAAILPLVHPNPPPRTGLAPNFDEAKCLLPSLLALASALALAQWTGHAAPMALYARDAKLHLIAYLAAAVVIGLLISDYVGRFRDRRSGNSLEGGSAKEREAAQ